VPFASGPTDVPGAWLLCAVLGVALLWLGRRSRLAAAAGGVVLLTAPATGLVARAVWGHYPTIDKAGSLHFYGEGAHWHAFDVTWPSTQLIGMSMGHLWVTALLDLVLPAFGAMNAQALLNLVLGWWLGARLVEATGTPRAWSLVAAFPLGLGLHALRDINWYTIEKSGLWPLTLYALLLVTAHRRGGGSVLAAGAAYAWAFFYNAYWGVLGALVGGAALLVGNPRSRLAVAVSALGALPLVFAQLPALDNAQLPPREAFAERAALDVLAPFGGEGLGPNWNRIPLLAALDLPVTVAALAGAALALAALRRPGPRAWSGPALVLGAVLAALLACGPVTPLWGVFSALPGMWRLAKPETFFHLTVLASCVLAGPVFARLRVPPWTVLVVQVALWLLLVRASTALYPAFSAWPG
jgi:hypothetical protein